MMSRLARRVSPPYFLNRNFDCKVCGGRFKVTKRTDVSANSSGILFCTCPYCKEGTPLNNDVHKNFKARLVTFVNSQVEPIKSIADPKVRAPVARLLDDFNRLLFDLDDE